MRRHVRLLLCLRNTPFYSFSGVVSRERVSQMNGFIGAGPIVFSTDGLPLADQLDAWNAAFGSLNAISASIDQAGANVRCEYWLLGQGVVLSSTRVAPSRFVRDHARSRKNQIDHWVLRVLRPGRGHLRHANFEATTSPGELVVFSMHETWTVDWEGAEWVSLLAFRATLTCAFPPA